MMKNDWINWLTRKYVIAPLAYGAMASCLTANTPANAATVTFSGPVSATNTSALDVQWLAGGTFVEAANVGDSSTKTFATAGGQNITFTAMPTSLGSVDMPTASSSTSGFYNGGSQWNTSIFVGPTDMTEWTDILRGNAWHNNASDAVRPLTLRLANLTIGQEYSVSLFAVDERTGSSDRTQAYWGGFSGGTFSGGSSSSFSTTSATMVIGTFVADATFQDIFIQETDGIGNDDTTLAAYSLYAIPEPASLALMGLGGLVMVARRRHA